MLQNELLTLEIAQLVYGVFSFIYEIILSAILSAKIACLTLSGIQTLMGDITDNDNFNFFGSKPSKYAFLSNVSGDI